MTHIFLLDCWVMIHNPNWILRCMTQICQQGLWGHDPDPELGVQGHDSDHPSTGSEGLWGHALNPMTSPIQPKFMTTGPTSCS